MKRLRTNWIWIVLPMIICLILAECAVVFRVAGKLAKPYEIDPEPLSGLTMTMLDVGQGLSVLIEANGTAILYDGGGRESSGYVVSYLKEHGISSIDVMVSSHYDSDHLAGLIGALHTCSVNTILCGDYVPDSKLYDSFMEAAQSSGAEIRHPVRGDTLELGELQIRVLAPENYANQKENDQSIAIHVQYGKTGFLLTGDAERASEDQMRKSGVLSPVQVYIVGHHGSASSSNDEFLKAVQPQYALISCGTANDYGLPAEAALERLNRAGCHLYRTDIQGEVICRSDGSQVFFDQEPTENWEAGTQYRPKDLQENPEGAAGQNVPVLDQEPSRENCTYVLNRNSEIFHYPWCKSVDKMSEKNTEYSTETREFLLEHGYKPCGSCRP